MSRSTFVLAAWGILLGVSGPAAAQFASPLGGYAPRMNLPYNPAPAYGPGYQTQLSPYLNFLRGGDPAANFYLGVLPEMQRRTNAAQFRGAIGSLQQQQQLQQGQQVQAGLDADLFTPLPTTGHPTVFGNYGGYFPQVNSLRRTGPSQQARPLNRSAGPRTPGRPR